MNSRISILCLVALALSCGRPKPCVTAEVPITNDLTFLMGGDPGCTVTANGAAGCANSPNASGVGDRTIPEHMVRLQPYFLDQTEVTNAQYRHCVDEGVCDAPKDCTPLSGALPVVPRTGQLSARCVYEDTEFDDVPVVAVTWEAARKYCEWVGKELPSEAQWERAAVGTRAALAPARKFAWGDQPLDSKLAHVVNGPSCFDQLPSDAPVSVRTQAREAGQSQEGVYDLTGNVREWVLDDFNQATYCASAGTVNRRQGVNECAAEVLECTRTPEALDTVTHDRQPPDLIGEGRMKVVRGGAFCATATSAVEHDCDLHTRSRSPLDQEFLEASNPVPGPQAAGYFDEAQTTGFRCARLQGTPAPRGPACETLPVRGTRYPPLAGASSSGGTSSSN